MKKSNQTLHSLVICYEKEVQDSAIGGRGHFHLLNGKFKLREHFRYIYNTVSTRRQSEKSYHTEYQVKEISITV